MSALVRRGAPLLAAILAFAGVGLAAAAHSNSPTCVTATGRTIPRPKHGSSSPRCAVPKSRDIRR